MKQFLSCICFLMSVLALGQKTLNFSDCLALAMAQNLEIQSANVNEEVLKYQYKASYGRLAPELRAEGFQRARFNQIYDFSTNSYIDNTVRELRGTVRANFNLFSGKVGYVHVAKQRALDIDDIWDYRTAISLNKYYV